MKQKNRSLLTMKMNLDTIAITNHVIFKSYCDWTLIIFFEHINDENNLELCYAYKVGAIC